MSNCCEGTTEGDPGDACPCCGAKGARVDPITLKSLLTGEGLRQGVPPLPRFCATKSCPVVYFDNAVPVRFDEKHVTVRVHAKHAEVGSVPVCYCFDYTPERIRAAVSSGRNVASEDIAREVKAGRCACEVKNPKGSCCLGDVSRVENAHVEAAAATRQEER